MIIVLIVLLLHVYMKIYLGGSMPKFKLLKTIMFEQNSLKEKKNLGKNCGLEIKCCFIY